MKLELQSFFTDGMLFVVGSGLSTAEGLPGMTEISSQLSSEIPGRIDGDSRAKWIEIESQLKAGNDIETALFQTSPTPDLEEHISDVVAMYLLDKEAQAIKGVISGSKTLRFSRLLDHVIKPNTGLQIVTTNYDRLLEVATEAVGLGVETMFVGDTIGELNESESRYSFCRSATLTGGKVRLKYAKRACIYKPHGSLDWYLQDEKPIRCPLPLGLQRLIITPGLNKFRTGYEQPFDRHIARANVEIDRASRYLIIGYGFNDDHLQTHLTQKLYGGTPALVITRSLSTNALEIMKKSSNLIALSALSPGADAGTRINFNKQELAVEGIDLWDLGIFVTEVLEP